jgi:hypothetical protein
MVLVVVVLLLVMTTTTDLERRWTREGEAQRAADGACDKLRCVALRCIWAWAWCLFIYATPGVRYAVMPTYISGLICCGVPPVQTNPIWKRRSPLSRTTSPPFSNRGVSESNPRWSASRTPSHRRRSRRAIQGLQVTGARRARGPLAPDQHPLGCCMERRRPNGAPPSTSSTPPAPPPGQWQWYAHIPPCFGSVQFFTRFPSY